MGPWGSDICRFVIQHVNHDVPEDLMCFHCCNLRTGAYFVQQYACFHRFLRVSLSWPLAHETTVPNEPKTYTIVLHFTLGCKQPHKITQILYSTRVCSYLSVQKLFHKNKQSIYSSRYTTIIIVPKACQGPN